MSRPSLIAGDRGIGLNRLQLFMMAFGAIVGVGWITILGHWLERAGPGGSVVALALGACAMLLVAANYAVLAKCNLLAAGGEIGAVAATLGDLPAFVTTAALALACLGIVAFEAVSAGWLIVTLLPAVEGPALYLAFGRDVHLGTLAITILSTLGIAMLNLRSLRDAANAQNAVVQLKIGVTAVLVIAALGHGEPGNLLPLIPPSASTTQTIAGVMGVAATMPLWYAGFNVIALLAGERDPAVKSATVGRLMCLSVLCACLFYVCIVLAASSVMPWRSLIVAALPAVSAYREGLDSALLANAVLVVGLLGIFSAWISCFAASVRVLAALRVQLRPGSLSISTASPSRSTVIAVAVIAIVLALNGRPALVPIANTAALSFGIVYMFVSWVAWRRAQCALERLTALLGAGVSTLMALVVAISAVADAGLRAPELGVVAVWATLVISVWCLRSRRIMK